VSVCLDSPLLASRPSLAVQRADEHSLQGFRLAPSALLPCLHDTQLQAPHPSMAVGPVRAPPIESRAGVRVRRLTLLGAVLRRGIAVILVKRDPAEVCTLSRGMMSALHLNPYPSHYRPAFASSAFLYPHPISVTLRLACSQQSRARIRAYRVPHEQPEGLGPAFPPGEFCPRALSSSRATFLHALLARAEVVARWLV
jgi:hypothetical protein